MINITKGIYHLGQLKSIALYNIMNTNKVQREASIAWPKA